MRWLPLGKPLLCLDLLSQQMRRKRFAFFLALLETVPRPVRILDVGGNHMFWETLRFTGSQAIDITLLTLLKARQFYPHLRSVQGDARAMPEFANASFDIVFSNSVIEHVGDYHDQQGMAEECMRVGQRYCIQTPNRFFPIEPHFLFPGFQFLPVPLRISLAYHLRLGWSKQRLTRAQTADLVRSIRLLTEHELRALFPGAQLYKERLLGLTKSFTAYDGFSVV